MWIANASFLLSYKFSVFNMTCEHDLTNYLLLSVWITSLSFTLSSYTLSERPVYYYVDHNTYGYLSYINLIVYFSNSLYVFFLIRRSYYYRHNLPFHVFYWAHPSYMSVLRSLCCYVTTYLSRLYYVSGSNVQLYLSLFIISWFDIFSFCPSSGSS